jgi:hypothetical protein
VVYDEATFSPLLFLILVEGISREMIDAKINSTLNCINISRMVLLSHLLFVNDILLRCDGYRRDDMNIKEILDLYCIVT